jgi:hypothetical protein
MYCFCNNGFKSKHRFFERYAHCFIHFSTKLCICKTNLFRPYSPSDKQWLIYQVWILQVSNVYLNIIFMKITFAIFLPLAYPKVHLSLS